MDLVALKTELDDGHPITGAYDADDAIAADQLNAVNRTLNKTSMTASEVFNSIDQAEFTALNNAQEAQIWNVLSMGVLDPFGLEASIFTDVFGGGSTTIAKLKADRKEPGSRAEELNLGVVTPSDVANAKAL